VDPIVIEALLVAGEGESVRVLLGPYCLDVDAGDVMALDELPLPDGLIEGSAIAGRLTLKPGARLLRLGAADAYRKVLWRQALPFALATRPEILWQVDSAMQAREREFFAARGLTERLA
jgi:hypothetical protein